MSGHEPDDGVHLNSGAPNVGASSTQKEGKKKMLLPSSREIVNSLSRLRAVMYVTVLVLVVLVVISFKWPIWSPGDVSSRLDQRLALRHQSTLGNHPAIGRLRLGRHLRPHRRSGLSSGGDDLATGRGDIMKMLESTGSNQLLDELDYEDAASNGRPITIIELDGEEFYVYKPGLEERHRSADKLSASASDKHGDTYKGVPMTAANQITAADNISDTLSGRQGVLVAHSATAATAAPLTSPAPRSNELVTSSLPEMNSTSRDVQSSELKRIDTDETSQQKESEQQQQQSLTNKLKPFQRPYCLGQKDSDLTVNYLCHGLHLIKVPANLDPKPMSLRLSSTGIEGLTRGSLMSYRDTLRDFSIENAPRLVSIEQGTFDGLTRLRVVYIFQAPKLISFDLAVSGLHPELTIIRIQQTGLRKWPDFSQFNQQRILNSVDLDNNKITTLGPKPINMRIELLNLEFNHINTVDEFTFNGSEIGILSLNGNRQLTYIHSNAFANLKNLVKLDLSSTSLQQLPTVGLHQLRNIIIRDTYTLKRIPSIYVFPMLEDAQLTYAYHCCWFRYPQRHDPSAYEEHLKLQEEINRMCADKRGQHQQHHNGQLQGRQQNSGATAQSINSDFEGFFEEEQKMASSPATLLAPAAAGSGAMLVTAPSKAGPADIHLPSENQTKPLASTVVTLASGTTKANEPNNHQSSRESKSSSGSNDFKKLLLMRDIECGEVAATNSIRNITCTPEPDAFNPCEDIMGYSVLRVAVWFVVGASVFGNLSVIVVLGGIFRRLSVPKFLQLNLAIGDMFMGVYLAALALADLTTVGTYFNYALDWQHGLGCKLAGAASLFASQLSIFTLSVITFERYYTITYSIDLNMRLQLGWAARIMVVGWLYAFTSAMLPIFANINSYSKTSICLPMRTAHLSDRLFIFVLLLIDSTAFVIIFACYLKMYLLIIRQKTQATAKERTVAMRMALLVSTDFACWAPIIFFSITALFGWPLISVTNSKILIVFFYPLNSMANPFLYVISTRQYRRDLNYLTVRWNMWRKNLFRRNQDSCYFSNNNNPYAVAGNQYINSGLNVHLGAVAAVTGIASHPRYTHVGAGGDARDDAGRGCLHGGNEQRVISTRSHQGRYVIRHQILTDRHPSGRLPTKRSTSRCGYGQSLRANNTGNRLDQPQRLDGTNDNCLDIELDWSGSSKLALPALSERQVEGDRGEKITIELNDRPTKMQLGAPPTEGPRNKKDKCRICNNSKGSLASCCTRCCCCKPKPVLASCGTLTTIISGPPTSQQQQQQQQQQQSPSPSKLVNLASVQEQCATSQVGPDAAVATSGPIQTDGRRADAEIGNEHQNCSRQDSSVTILGNISSFTEPTSSYSNFSSNSQFEVPVITVRGQQDEVTLRVCSKTSKCNPQHTCRANRSRGIQGDRHPDDHQNQHRHHRHHRHHDHHHHHHHRRRQHHPHQSEPNKQADATEEVTTNTDSTNPSSHSLDPSERSRRRQHEKRNSGISNTCNHRKCRHRNRHNNHDDHHHHHHHHHQHQSELRQFACKENSPNKAANCGTKILVESSEENSIQVVATDEIPLDKKTQIGGPKDSPIFSNSSRALRTSSSEASKHSVPLGSILKSTSAANDDFALADMSGQLEELSFTRGGSLKSPRPDKKRVSIISPHHSG